MRTLYSCIKSKIPNASLSLSIRNPKSEIRNHNAFSLIEMIVVMVILSIVAVSTVHYVVNMSDVYVMIIRQKRADDEATTALCRMRREIRTLKTTLTADGDELSFVNQNNVTNTFKLSGSDLTLNDNILAKNVDTFVLAYYDTTNGVLDDLPLTPLYMSRIGRIELDLSVTKGKQSRDLDVNIFYP
ncbi:PilW family protein [Verrucomicrobiota bacterium]